MYFLILEPFGAHSHVTHVYRMVWLLSDRVNPVHFLTLRGLGPMARGCVRGFAVSRREAAWEYVVGPAVLLDPSAWGPTQKIPNRRGVEEVLRKGVEYGVEWVLSGHFSSTCPNKVPRFPFYQMGGRCVLHAVHEDAPLPNRCGWQLWVKWEV